MDEVMEYAEMLEIPVSTVNVTQKRTRKSKKPQTLKERVITKVNDSAPANKSTQNIAPTLEDFPLDSLSQEDATRNTADTSDNLIIAESSPIAIPRRKKQSFFSRILGKSDDSWANEENEELSNQQPTSPTNSENDSLPIYNYNLWNSEDKIGAKQQEKRNSLIVAIEFAACFALCLGIFLTNVFMPNSAINTFFRSMNTQEEPVDTRTYADFQLSAVLSEEDAELTLSPTGILSFTEAGCVYPAADGVVDSLTQNNDGSWTIKIVHSATFSEVISGLTYASCSVGSAVKTNVPLGYSGGETEVQVSMYDSGALLNCFYITENGNLAWSE